jgi:hypothetical protein
MPKYVKPGERDIEGYAFDKHFLTKNEIDDQRREALRLEMFMERYADQGTNEYDQMLKIRKQDELFKK